MIVEDSGKTFIPVPPGMHLARCYRIIDLGTQKSEFEGNIKFLRKVKFMWEVHSESDDGTPTVTDKGEPMVISKDYTVSWGEKATLRIDLQSWRGKPFSEEEQRRFDLKNVLDKWCMLNIVHKPRQKGGVFANITTVNPVPKALRDAGVPDGYNKAEIFQISEPNMVMFEAFPDWLKKIISESPEWRAKEGKITKTEKDPGLEDLDDDIPFN